MRKVNLINALLFAASIGLVAFIAGYLIGTYNTINFCVDIGLKIMKSQNVSLGIDESLIKKAIFIYRNQLGYLAG